MDRTGSQQIPSSLSPPPASLVTGKAMGGGGGGGGEMGGNGMVSLTSASPEPVLTAGQIPVHGEVPGMEPNANMSTGDRSPIEEEKSHGGSNEGERIVEWGGPGSRYGKFNVLLGKGAYKIVSKAIDKEEGIEVAWNCCQTTRNEFNEFSDEVEILKKVRHPNIITFHDSWYSNGEFIFITELMTSGTLREFIKKLKCPSLKIIRRWARQILKGLVYLHSHSPPIIHRDIKCDNIFINGSHGEVKIGDMGTAKMRFGKKYTLIGTPEFMAPEMYEEKGYSEKVDIYAFGMCILEMVTGEYPYAECKNAAQIYKKVTQGIKPECLAKVQDKEVLSFILSCLAPEHERWSAKKLIDHPFLLEEPEVFLISTNEHKTRLKLQVLFKGLDKHTIKFEYNRETDTAEEVVREMIDEKVLPAKYQGLVCNEIHRILREISKTAPLSDRCDAIGPAPSTPRMVEEIRSSGHRRQPSDMEGLVMGAGAANTGNAVPRSNSHSRQGEVELDPKTGMIIEGLRRTSLELRQSESFDSEGSLKEYSNEVSIDEFIMDVAVLTNRPQEKALEWLVKLKNEDILTVGDLRDLHEEDWPKLNLTVFACRAIRNGLRGKSAGKMPALDHLSPRVTGRPINAGNPAPAAAIPSSLPSESAMPPLGTSVTSTTTSLSTNLTPS